MRDCNVFKYLLYTCHFCESFLYCNNKPTHHRRKYMKSNVLYVVTQGQNYVILKQLLVFLGSIYFFQKTNP